MPLSKAFDRKDSVSCAVEATVLVSSSAFGVRWWEVLKCHYAEINDSAAHVTGGEKKKKVLLLPARMNKQVGVGVQTQTVVIIVIFWNHFPGLK